MGTQSQLTVNYIFIPELTVAALRLKQDRILCAWYVLDRINRLSDGSGSISRREASKLLRSSLKWARSTVSQVLDRGNGSYWNIGTNRVNGKPQLYLTSIKTLAKVLEVKHMNIPELRSITELQQPYGKLRQIWYYAAEYKPKVDNHTAQPVSRAKQSNRFGRTVRTLRRWEHKAQSEQLEILRTTRKIKNFTVLETYPSMDAAVEAHLSFAGCYIDGPTVSIRNGYTNKQGIPGYNSLAQDDMPRATGRIMPRFIEGVGPCIAKQEPNTYIRFTATIQGEDEQYLRNVRKRNKTQKLDKSLVRSLGEHTSAFVIKERRDYKDRRRSLELIGKSQYRGQIINLWNPIKDRETSAWGMPVYECDYA